MDAERWRRVSAIYRAALAASDNERERILDEACGEDAEIRREVALLLAQAKSGADILSQSTGARAVPAAAVIGLRIGVYHVLERVGAGGMGEVYRATDTRLRRDVAIKILPQTFTSDPERIGRFGREARVLASLNHPNIATVHGLEDIPSDQADRPSTAALVMEFVDGETLADRIARGAVPVAEATRLAQQIADGLSAAHERGIVHRDLKPANIKIRPDGTVKVLDFGLAKTIAGDRSSEQPTMTIGATSDGVIVGTAAYMSPEQARGQAVDTRTDIWAFGCVVYEMLSGKPPFKGPTMPDTLTKILEHEPDWTALPRATPPAVTRMLRRCLEKDVRRRLRDIADARFDIEDATPGSASGDTADPSVRAITRRTAIGVLAGAAAGVAATGAVGLLRYRGDATSRSLARFGIPLAEGQFFNASFNKRVAISPTGTHIACNAVPGPGGGASLLVRSLVDLEMRPAAEGARGVPFFSPDGRWLGYFATDNSQRMRKVALTGGAAVNVCTTDNFSGATWAGDDVIYFIPAVPGGMFGVPAAGGDPQPVLDLDLARGERLYKFPHAVQDTAVLLLTVGTVDTESYDDATIVAFDRRTGDKRVVVEGGTCPCYSPSGHLVYARNGNLLAVAFSPGTLEPQGQPFTVLEGVLMSRDSGLANFDVSANGDLVYIPGRAVGGSRTLHWVDRNGGTETLPLPARSYLHPRLSPDATRLAIEVEGSDHDVYVYDFSNGVLSNLTTDGVSHWPVWSPDGSRIGYRSGPMGRFQLFEIAADRSRPPEQIRAAGVSQSASSYTPDGRALVYEMAEGPAAPPRIAVAPLDGVDTPRPLGDAQYAQGSPKVSPDGRYIAYCSNESGRLQVYVQVYPGPGAKVQVSVDGGTDPIWRRDGRELFYRNGPSMMAVPIASEPRFAPGRPSELWRGDYSHGMSSSCGAPGLSSSNYDVSADGQRFLMIKDDDVGDEIAREIVLVQGWAVDLQRRVTQT